MGFKEDFEEANQRFLWILSTFKEVSAISKELRKMTKGKTFRVHNQAVYDMYIAQYKLLFVNTFSFCHYMCTNKGPLRNVVDRLYECEKPDFVFTPLDNASLLQLSFENQLIYSHQKSEYEKFPKCIYPNSCKVKPCTCNFEFLISKFEKLKDSIGNDRNLYAHVFEKKGKNLPLKELKDIEKIITTVNQLMGNLGWFANIAWSTDISSFTSEERVAKDIVDQILCGTIDQILFDSRYNVDADFKVNIKKSGNRFRFYSRLHEMHEQLKPEEREKILFNDRTKRNSSGIYYSNKKLKYTSREVDWNEFPDERSYHVRKVSR